MGLELRGDGSVVFHPCQKSNSYAARFASDGEVLLSSLALHDVGIYVNRLPAATAVLSMDVFRTAQVVAFGSSAAYEGTCHSFGSHMDAHLNRAGRTQDDWRLVQFVPEVRNRSYISQVFDFHDTLALAQNKFLDCMLIFQGTDAELPVNFDFEPIQYCGFKKVMRGYVQELETMLDTHWHLFKPKLGQCRTVTVAGHSLGGALASLLSACANSASVVDSAVRRIRWSRGTPTRMERFRCERTFLETVATVR